MQALILLGGKGTRLRALCADRPKALVPVAGHPFLEWQIEWLSRGGIRDIHLAAGHLARPLAEAAAAAPRRGPLTLAVEPEPLGTGGGLKFAELHLRSDPFLILNGDSLLPNLDFRALQAQPPEGALLTMAATFAADAGRFGTVRSDEHGRVTAFLEKAAAREGWINGGVYLARRALLDRIPAGRPVSLEHEVFPALCAEGKLAVFRAPPPLLDMGTPEGLEAMAAYLAAPAPSGPAGRA